MHWHNNVAWGWQGCVLTEDASCPQGQAGRGGSCSWGQANGGLAAPTKGAFMRTNNKASTEAGESKLRKGL